MWVCGARTGQMRVQRFRVEKATGGMPWMDRGDRRQVTVGTGEEKLDESGYKSSRVGEGVGDFFG